METAEKVQNYWRNANEPKYKDPIERSEFLYKFIKKEIPKDAKIVEIGCNCGRNLNYLYEKGYKNLTGIEISTHTVENMKEFYDIKWEVINKKVEDCIKELKDVDCYFTMAVLEHIHPDSEWIFDEMKKAKYIVTVEDEIHSTERHIPRDYSVCFKDKHNELKSHKFTDNSIFDPSFVARIFRK